MVILKSHMVLNSDTIGTLAEYLGISRQTLSGRMNGRSRFKLKEIMMIADRYRLDSDAIVEIFLKEELH